MTNPTDAQKFDGFWSIFGTEIDYTICIIFTESIVQSV
jgi:hypothetical protein